MEVVLNFTKGLEHEVSRPGLEYHSKNRLSVILHKEYLNSLIATLFNHVNLGDNKTGAASSCPLKLQKMVIDLANLNIF